MPDNNSEYNQQSFIGGMSLLGDDTRLQSNQYRAGFNLTNRYDELDLIPSSIEDTSAPEGIKQGLTTFGNYEILFCAGNAYFKLYSDIGWTVIPQFKMSQIAPRFWTCPVPVSLTNYVRYASTGVIDTQTSASVNGPINTVQVAGASGGNLPGLLVQDNTSQPLFIFLDVDGNPTVRTTQTYAQWQAIFTDGTGNTFADNGDQREYVPIGNCMTWDNGVLYITSQDLNFIYPSVSGRPLDFVRNVTNALPQGPGYILTGGGDATTTSYSVGVGGISCIRPLSSGGIFVSASGANFAVTQNTTPNAPTEFGEYTFIRTFLFSAFCLSDRAIIDSIGDTRFIDLSGIRSFNAVEQVQNEGRNSVFSNTIQGAINGIIQDATVCSATYFDNYELYSVMTIFGAAIIKYDTVNMCWVSFDIQQVPGKRIKQFAPLQINVLALFAITEDDKVFQLYASPTQFDTGVVRSVGVCSNILYANIDIKMNNPKMEVKLNSVRIILNKLTEDSNITMSAFCNNRLVSGPSTKLITYEAPAATYVDPYVLPDVNTQLSNVMFNTPSVKQGWKVFVQLSWTGGVITQYSMELDNLTPQNPLNSQTLIK